MVCRRSCRSSSLPKATDVTIHGIMNETQIGEAVAAAASSAAEEVLFISSQQALVRSFLNAHQRADRRVRQARDLPDRQRRQRGRAQGVQRGGGVVSPGAGQPAQTPHARRTTCSPASSPTTSPSSAARIPPEPASWAIATMPPGWASTARPGRWSPQGKVDGLGIARGLRRVSSGTPTDIVPSSLTKVVQAFRAGASVNRDRCLQRAGFRSGDPRRAVAVRDLAGGFQRRQVPRSSPLPRSSSHREESHP